MDPSESLDVVPGFTDAFECDPPEAGKRRHGYSRDKRSDCVQVVIALIVTPDGEAGQRFRQAMSSDIRN